MNDQHKYFLYARKSTDVEDKQVHSIEAQLYELREFVKRENLHIVEELEERRSAMTPGRPVFNSMIERIRKGEADGILAWHPDRLARNSMDGGQIIYLLDINVIKSLKFPRTWFENTPQGKLMLHNEFGFSKYYSDSLSAHVKKGLDDKVRRREYPGLAPFGYLNDPRIKQIVPEGSRALLVKDIFEKYASGESTLDDLRSFLEERGIKTSEQKMVGRSFVSRILSNPIYYGHFKFAGEVHEGNHKPIIPKSLFDRAQTVLNRRWRYSPAPKKANPKAFLGLIRCGECGSYITGELQKGHVYYRCTKKNKAIRCSQRYVREELLDAQLSKLFCEYSLPSHIADEMLKQLHAEDVGNKKLAQEEIARKRVQVKKIEDKLQRLLESFLDAVIEREDYLREKSKLISEKKTIEENIATLVKGQNQWLEPFKNWILTAKNMEKVAKEGSLHEKRDLAHAIFGSNLTLMSRKARGTALEPWSLIPEYAFCSKVVGWQGLEPWTNALKGHCSTN